MPKSAILLIIWVLGVAYGQNLVPNWNFDTISQCPYDRGQIEFAPPWFSPNGKTTDLTNICGLPDITWVPSNDWGYQAAFDGRGYAGIRTIIPPEPGSMNYSRYREYLAAPLVKPLQAGQRYKVQFMVSPGESGGYVTDDVAMALVDSMPPDDPILPYQAALQNPEGEYLRNFSTWKPVWGSYLAKGGESYVVIGNFKEDPQTNYLREGGWDSLDFSTYLYIDGVVVEPCAVPAGVSLILKNEPVICPGEMAELQINPDIHYEELMWEDGSDEPIFYTSDEGWHYISLEDSIGCQLQDSIYVVKKEAPELDLGPDTLLCEGQQVLLVAHYDPDAEYVWNTGSTENYILVNQSGMYELSLRKDGCEVVDQVKVEVEHFPDYSLGFDSLLCENQSILLESPISGLRFYWDTGDFTEAIEVDDQGLYELWVETHCYQIPVQFQIDFEDCRCEALIPNIFTPNGDGINDRWKVQMAPGIQHFEVQVFNRWGQQLFYSRQQNFEWSGENLRANLPVDVYFYAIHYQCLASGEWVWQVKTGDLSLFR